MVMNHKPLAKPDAPPHAPKTFCSPNQLATLVGQGR